MATVVLVRHGRSTANTAGVLAGRTGGVPLDETGHAQARRAADRLAPVRLQSVVTSPLQRCSQTAAAIVVAQPDEPSLERDRGLLECDYGEWQGRRLQDLSRERLWRTVQRQPSAAVFPGGESLAAMSARAVAAVRRRAELVESEYGSRAVVAAVTHGDLIKAVLADALGLHLDSFQRLHVDPASISMVRYTADRPVVLGVNTHEGDLSWLAPPRRRRGGKRGADAPVGGGAGPA